MDRIMTSRGADVVELESEHPSDGNTATLNQVGARLAGDKQNTNGARDADLSPHAVDARVEWARHRDQGARELECEDFPQQLETRIRAKRHNLIQACLTKFYASVPPPEQLEHGKNYIKIGSWKRLITQTEQEGDKT